MIMSGDQDASALETPSASPFAGDVTLPDISGAVTSKGRDSVSAQPHSTLDRYHLESLTRPHQSSNLTRFKKEQLARKELLARSLYKIKRDQTLDRRQTPVQHKSLRSWPIPVDEKAHPRQHPDLSKVVRDLVKERHEDGISESKPSRKKKRKLTETANEEAHLNSASDRAFASISRCLAHVVEQAKGLAPLVNVDRKKKLGRPSLSRLRDVERSASIAAERRNSATPSGAAISPATDSAVGQEGPSPSVITPGQGPAAHRSMDWHFVVEALSQLPQAEQDPVLRRAIEATEERCRILFGNYLDASEHHTAARPSSSRQ
ncbi:hypothetical protein BCV70DRAFT_239699 [Testicularia cyperi]|uniref:Uncharacterized protein n=1 Tax=Testicularia cyperi TaxID=1882483 RepID=A0A317XHD8_9BASI|nr:hypothetical protein BCV70DRAFT_239699 [Testicularia cyperi]